MSNKDVKRLAYRAGIQRTSRKFLTHAKDELKNFVTKVISNAIVYTTHSNRSTVTTLDIVYALKRQNRTLHTYGG